MTFNSLSTAVSQQFNHISDNIKLVCLGRGKNYCLVHRVYFETSWCPDCGRSKYCPLSYDETRGREREKDKSVSLTLELHSVLAVDL